MIRLETILTLWLVEDDKSSDVDQEALLQVLAPKTWAYLPHLKTVHPKP